MTAPLTNKTVAILRLSSAGDVLLTQPALTALRLAWPQARLVFVTQVPFAPLVQAQPHIDAVVALQRDASLAAWHHALAATKPDIILDLHDKWRSRVLRLSILGARRVVWHKRPWGQSAAVRLWGARVKTSMHLAQRYHAAVEKLCGQSLPRAPLHFVRQPLMDARADACLRSLGIVADKRLIGMSPGAMWETKRWPVERFAALAARLVAAGQQVLLTGSRAEAALHTAIIDQVPQAKSAAGQGDLAMLASLIARCQVFVANDSGPMHLARAVRVPTVAVFGSTDPAQFDFAGHALLYANVPCAPCSFYGRAKCPLGHMQCLHAITVDQAEAALVGLLETQTSSATTTTG